MKGNRTERLVRITSRLLLRPSRPISVTEAAVGFGVSKTLVSDDIAMIADALEAEGSGSVVTDRGRRGGACFIPSPSAEVTRARLSELAELLSVPERMLPGGLVYYTDILFDPDWASFLGFATASMFMSRRPTAVMTTEVKGMPVAFFTAYALGVPLAVCRYRNRPSDGPAVGVHFATGNGDVRTMYLGTQFIDDSSRVLLVDDFMRGGSTAAGMMQMTREFGSEVVGVGIFISAREAQRVDLPDCRPLLELAVDGGVPSLSVCETFDADEEDDPR